MSSPAQFVHAWDTHGSGQAPRYRDAELRCEVIKVMPGAFELAAVEDVLVSILGSCVAACIRDPLLAIGGMNHFMLPDDERKSGVSNARYGAYAMEVLINELIKRGARRERLEAKVFGGASVIRGFESAAVGRRNSQFVLEYLAAERIAVAAQDLGGNEARKIAFFVRSGQVKVRYVSPIVGRADLTAEQTYGRTLRHAQPAGEVELFD